MLIVGEDAVFLSHLPLFSSPHDYQVILAATFTAQGSDPQRAYAEDRRAHPEAKIYTFDPKPFVLPELFPPDPQHPPRLESFRGDIYRGHFERFPSQRKKDAARIAADVAVQVTAVVHARRFVPGAEPPKQLRYLLFGTGREMFLCHLVTRPPDFDQVLAVKVTGQPVTDAELRGGVPVSLPGRPNSVAGRLKPGEKMLPGMLELPGRNLQVQVEPGVEFYLEEDELSSP